MSIIDPSNWESLIILSICEELKFLTDLKFKTKQSRPNHWKEITGKGKKTGGEKELCTNKDPGDKLGFV